MVFGGCPLLERVCLVPAIFLNFGQKPNKYKMGRKSGRMKTFDLTFKGTVLPEYDSRQVKARFAQLFCIKDLAVIEELFSGETVILRSDLDRKSAADYFRKITQIGGEAELVESTESHAAPGQLTVKLEQDTASTPRIIRETTPGYGMDREIMIRRK